MVFLYRVEIMGEKWYVVTEYLHESVLYGSRWWNCPYLSRDSELKKSFIFLKEKIKTELSIKFYRPLTIRANLGLVSIAFLR